MTMNKTKPRKHHVYSTSSWDHKYKQSRTVSLSQNLTLTRNHTPYWIHMLMVME